MNYKNCKILIISQEKFDLNKKKAHPKDELML